MSRVYDEEVYKDFNGMNGVENESDQLIEELYQGQHKDEEDFALNLLDSCWDFPENLLCYFNLEEFATDLFAYDYNISDNGHVFRR